MLDFNALDVLTGSEEGRWCYPLHPKTGLPIPLPGGKGNWGVKLRGRHSAVVRDATRAMTDERAAMESQGRVVSEQDSVRMLAEYLAKASIAWEPMSLDGAELPFTHDNAVKLYSDPRFRWLEPQLRAFVVSDGNFFPA